MNAGLPLSPARTAWANRLDRGSIALYALLTGALGMTGAAAAIAFPTMRELAPSLGAYPMYPGTHWTLAAGEVMRRVFTVSDVVMLATGVLGGLALTTSFALRLRAHRPSPTEWVRILLALGLLGMIAYQAIFLRPAMNEELFAYLDAASIGDAANADMHRENFSAMHPTASRSLSATFGIALASTLLGVWSRRDG